MKNNLLYIIKKEEHNESCLKKILKLHTEIKFVSLMAVDLSGNVTDERIPIKVFLEDLEKFLYKTAVQTDGSSVDLPEIATINDAKVDMGVDKDCNWVVDYNEDLLDEETLLPIGTIIIPAFLYHNGKQVDSRSILKLSNEKTKQEIMDLIKIKKDLFKIYEIKPEEIEKINYTTATELEFWVKTPNEETEIDFKFDDENSILLDNIEITANENTKSTVIIKYISNQENENYHNGIIKAKAKENSELNIILINLMNIKSNNFLAIENDFEKNAKINYTIIDFGGKNSITNYYSNLLGDSCDNQLNTIYLGKENQLFDLNYIGELRGKKSNIDIEVQGALKDVAKKHFKGTIDFKKGCKKATGNENEACMLLSDTAKSIALPMLLCSEEEVEGNHSSSAGKIGEKELFYIMSRGRFNKILENIKNEELKDEILKEIDMRLD